MCLHYTLALLHEAAEEARSADTEYIRKQPHLTMELKQTEDWGLSPWSPGREAADNATFQLEEATS